jgi:diguanylate cyclase (GGDEF)-like protein
MVRSGASRVIDAVTLLPAIALPTVLLAVVRVLPPVDVAAAGLGWVIVALASVTASVGAVLAAGALVVGLRRGSMAALLGVGAAAAASGGALALALAGEPAPLFAALPVAALLGVATAILARRRPAIPGRRMRTGVAALGLVAAEAAVLAGLLPVSAEAVTDLRIPLLAGAAATLTAGAVMAPDRRQAGAGMAAALAAIALLADRGGGLELLIGLLSLIGAGAAGIVAVARSHEKPRPAPTHTLPALADHLHEAILRFDGRLGLTDWNRAAASLLGLDDAASGTRLDDLLGVPIAALPADERPAVVETALAGLEVRLHREGDGLLAVVSEASERTDDERLGRELRGTIQELLGARRTIELQRRELGRLAAVDPLTGTASRAAIIDRLRIEVAQARRYHHPVAIVLLDVDRFSEINAVHGVGAGDALLREVALRMRLRVREADAIGRAGSDGFVAALPHTDEAGAATFAEALRRRLSRAPMLIGDELVDVTASLGVAVMRPGEELDLDGLLARAVEALESAKTAGGDRIALDRLHGLARLDHRDESSVPSSADDPAV